MSQQLSILQFVTMDAPSGAISPAQSNGKNLSAKIKMPKRLYRGPPFLKSFPLFPKLPLEIRMMIWKLTLQPRILELQFSYIRGFFTKAKGPVALRVNQESRNTVKPLYPLCFGNVVYQPRVLFNFSIDTLFLEHDFQPQLLLFLASLKLDEMVQLKYLAVDTRIDTDYGDGEHADIDTELVIRNVVPSMIALKEIRLIIDLDYCPEIDIEHPSGNGPMELFDDNWPNYVRDYHIDYHEAMCDCDGECFGLDSDDELCGCHDCGCMDLPELDHDWEQVEGPTVCYAWGWRPVPNAY
jgi:hypothetical protein